MTGRGRLAAWLLLTTGVLTLAQDGSAEDAGRPIASRGPVFVSLDNWVYPVLLRLAGMGFIPDQAAGMRPWTRRECARQLAEAEVALERLRPGALAAEAAMLISMLRHEFAGELAADGLLLRVDSVYIRALGLAGSPLVDGYNFGQTIVNDFGRPFGEGTNAIMGFSGSAVAGRFSFNTRFEFQRAAPFSSPAAALAAGNGQIVPVLGGAPNGLNRFEPQEMYAGVEFGRWSLTAGKQTLWWGPGESGPLSFGDNAAPFFMFRLTTASPVALPGFLRELGLFKLDFAGGELSGHQFPPRPLMNAQKLSWNISEDLEVGFSRWSLFGGAGVRGFTAGAVIRNLFANGATFGNAIDPGDRKSGFDLRWRPPLPGHQVTLYADLYADDEPSPLASPRRSALNPGVYMAQFPGLPHWDLRVEAPSTRSLGQDRGGEFFYWNNVYRDANTNGAQLLGTWAGRDGRGLLIQSAWWRSDRSRFRFAWRQNRVGGAFLPGGGTQNDASVQGDFGLGADWLVTALIQFERYSFPVLSVPRRNLSTSIEVMYKPGWRLSR